MKLDGYRALVIKEKGHVRLYSRRTNLLNDRFPKIAQALESLEDGVIADGEIVALDSAGRPSFSLLQHHKKTDAPPIVFYVFDLLAYRGRDITSLPLHQRRELLEKVLVNVTEPIRPSVLLRASVNDLIAAVKQKGFEGVIAKQSDSRYIPGARSGHWVKYKVNQGQELVIGGYKPSAKNHFESLAVGYYDDKRLIFAAKIKTGFTSAIKDELFSRFHKLEMKTCPFANLPEAKGARWGKALIAEEMKKYRWLRPKLVAQIEFTNWTSANNLRHAKFIALRDDKDPKEVVREVPKAQ